MPVKRQSLVGVLRRLRSNDDRGAALVAVIGLLLVSMILAAGIGTATVSAMSVSTMNRASVQSEAAAEAGINAAELGLRTAGDCDAHNGVYTSTSAPRYTSKVSYYALGVWIAGCPLPALASQVKVVSTGYAAAKGVQGASAGDSSKLEATYPYATATGTITGTGGAVFGGSTNGLNNLTVNPVTTVTPGGTTPDVVISNGSFTCQNGTTISGNLIVQNGSLDLNGCIVLGSVKVSGYVSVNNGSTVNGDVIAAGLNLGTVTGPNGAVGYVYNSIIKGNLLVGGKVYLQNAKVLKNVTGVSAPSVASTVDDTTKIGGNLALSGTVNTWGLCGLLGQVTILACFLLKGIVGLASSTLTTGLAPLTAPPTTTWAGYSYVPSAWTAAGYTEKMWTGSCTVDNNAANKVAIAQIMASTTPLVVNALACTKLLFSSSAALQLKLHANVAFISNSFGLENTTIDSATSVKLKAWFIVPGASLKSLLQIKLCLDVDGHVNLNSGVKVTANVSALIYTPGCVDDTATVWQGQIYSGTVNFGQNVTLNFEQVGLPGVSLDGTTVSASTPGALGARSLLRDVSK